jgi:hypothetical protein
MRKLLVFVVAAIACVGPSDARARVIVSAFCSILLCSSLRVLEYFVTVTYLNGIQFVILIVLLIYSHHLQKIYACLYVSVSNAFGLQPSCNINSFATYVCIFRMILALNLTVADPRARYSRNFSSNSVIIQNSYPRGNQYYQCFVFDVKINLLSKTNPPSVDSAYYEPTLQTKNIRAT